MIPTLGLRLDVIKPANLDATNSGGLRRNQTSDLSAVAGLLKAR